MLDIGCNCGFFTIVVSRYVKYIEGLDINPYLINIADDVKISSLGKFDSNF